MNENKILLNGLSGTVEVSKGLLGIAGLFTRQCLHVFKNFFHYGEDNDNPVSQQHSGCSRYQTILRLLSWHLPINESPIDCVIKHCLQACVFLGFLPDLLQLLIQECPRVDVKVYILLSSSLQAIELFDKVHDVIIVFPGQYLMISL